MWDTLIINPMVNTLLWIYSMVGHNFGIAIILFTILIRLITHPLTVSQLKSTKAMSEMQKSPKFQEIQKKYKDDKEKLQQEQMKLYQEMGVNPLSSCLPTLIQFPIMIGLYQAIVRALAVTPTQLLDLSRHIYPFIPASTLIPINNHFLWMNLNVAEKDFGINIAGIGIPVLAIIVVLTSFIQTKMMTPASANPNDQSAQMAKTMNLTMPLFMGYISYIYSSGLALYFVVGNIIQIVQYALLGQSDWRNILPASLRNKLPEIKSLKSGQDGKRDKALPEPKNGKPKSEAKNEKAKPVKTKK